METITRNNERLQKKIHQKNITISWDGYIDEFMMNLIENL